MSQDKKRHPWAIQSVGNFDLFGRYDDHNTPQCEEVPDYIKTIGMPEESIDYGYPQSAPQELFRYGEQRIHEPAFTWENQISWAMKRRLFSDPPKKEEQKRLIFAQLIETMLTLLCA